MSKSELQEPFLEELINSIRASRKRLAQGLTADTNEPDERLKEYLSHLKTNMSEEKRQMIDTVFWDELRGVLHSFLVTLDGGTALADRGLIRIQDEGGVEFDRYLHELAFSHLTEEELA